MVITLHSLPASPPGRCVVTTLHVLGLEFEEKHINSVAKEHKKPAFLAMNPRGCFPVLTDGDFVIAESFAIAMYLCNKYEKGENRLYPLQPEVRGKVDQLLFVGSVIYDAALQYLNLLGVIYDGGVMAPEKLPGVYHALGLCEAFLQGDFMVGDHITLADIFMSCGLYLLDLVDFNDYGAYPKTVAWLKRVRNWSYFKTANDEGMKELENIYRPLLAKNTQNRSS